MALSTQPYKGARDFYPEDYRIQQWMFNRMGKVLKRFGYERYDAPIVEPLDLYAAKSGQEIVSEQTYSFTDRGGRQVAIRPEMTPTVSRMVAAKRQELAYPLRLYSIPNLWRYERPQKGRLREHWQLNVDLFGVSGIEAEHEMVLVIDALMQAYGAKRHMYTIKINSRALTNHLLKQYLGLDKVQLETLIKLIDKMHKIARSEYLAQLDAILTPTQRENGTENKLLELLAAEQLEDLPEAVHTIESVQKLKKLMELAHKAGIKNIAFDVTLMRGFDYYTDIVFEVFDTSEDNNRAMFGGGRYDGLVHMFGVEPVPTIGFGMGDVTLRNFLESHNLLPALTSETDAYVILVGDVYAAAQPALGELRTHGVRLAVDATERKTAAKIKSATKKGIDFALFIGQKELADERFTLRNLHTGEEKTMSIERLVSTLKDYRRK